MMKKGYHDEKPDTIEFQIDDSDVFLELIHDLPLRSMLSIRRNLTMKTRIVVGQEESMFLPHGLKKMFWTIEDHIPIKTKTDGMGMMTSLLITREFGFAFNLTEKNLQEVLVIAKKKKSNTLP